MRDIIVVTPPVVAYNFAYLALAWGLALGSIALFWAHQRWYTFLLAFLVVSSRQQALLNVEHECGHGKFAASRRWNTFVGRWLSGAAVGSPYGAARARHLSHHRLLATPGDPDHDLHAGPGKRTRGGMFKHFIGGMLGGYAGMVLMGPPRKDGSALDAATRRRDALSLGVVQLVIAAALTLAFDWWVYPAVWLAPLATLTVLSHLVRSFVEHAVTDDEIPAHANRLITIRSNFIERAIVAPYSMNYHAEHHLLPTVPAPRLRDLHARLTERDDLPPVLVRTSYGQAIRRYVRALPDGD